MKNAIVTGGTKGIGLSIAKMLLKENYFVYITYATDVDAAQQAELELCKINSAFCIKRVNQLYAEQIHFFTKELENQSIDCIVCNAGSTIRKATPDITDNEWNDIMQINVHFWR